MDLSGANNAAIKQYNAEELTRLKNRQCKYLNNVVEQDNRLIKRITKSMLGFKKFHCSQVTLADIELIRMIRKGQIGCQASMSKTYSELFYGQAG